MNKRFKIWSGVPAPTLLEEGTLTPPKRVQDMDAWLRAVKRASNHLGKHANATLKEHTVTLDKIYLDLNNGLSVVIYRK